MKLVLGILLGIFVLVVVGATGYIRAVRAAVTAVEPVTGHVFHVRNGFVDVYAAQNGSRILLFDAGMDPKGAPVDALLKALKAQRSDLTDFFISHCHPDHVAALPAFPIARIHAGRADSDRIAQKDSSPIASKVFDWGIGQGPAEVRDQLSERQEIPVGGPMRVIAIPLGGHTAGSFAYFYQGVLFAGDALQISDGKLELTSKMFAADYNQSLQSLKKLRSQIGGAGQLQFICTGHEGCTPEGQADFMLNELVMRMGEP